MLRLLCILLLIPWSNLTAQQAHYFPFDTLSKDDIRLEKINHRGLNTYQFITSVKNNSIFFILPTRIPRGYYELYYDNDTNHLALAYYNYGMSAYSQQFYHDCAMKSDSEYNAKSQLHGLHTLYAKNGDELWHAEYYYGVWGPKYRLDYLAVVTETQAIIKAKKAVGSYQFTPTPSRARRDRIELTTDSIFYYTDSKGDDYFCNQYKATWYRKGDYLFLTLDNKNIWRKATRKFVLVSSVKLTNFQLIEEIKDWGVEWFNSEYQKVK